MAEENLDAKYKEYMTKDMNQYYRLKGWVQRMHGREGDNYSIKECWKAIYNGVDGKVSQIKPVIEALAKGLNKTYGRANTAYGDEVKQKVDIVKHPDGHYELTGYIKGDDNGVPDKGQKRLHNDKIWTKSGEINKTYKNQEERFKNIESRILKDLYPKMTTSQIESLMFNCLKYANQHKINPMNVIDMIEKGKIRVDADGTIYDTNEYKEFKEKRRRKRVSESQIRLMIQEELNRSDVRSIIDTKLSEFLKERELEKKIKDIIGDTFERYFKMMYTKRGFWKNDIKNG
jgi:hypothetical protein